MEVGPQLLVGMTVNKSWVLERSKSFFEVSLGKSKQGSIHRHVTPENEDCEYKKKYDAGNNSLKECTESRKERTR